MGAYTASRSSDSHTPKDEILFYVWHEEDANHAVDRAYFEQSNLYNLPQVSSASFSSYLRGQYVVPVPGMPHRLRIKWPYSEARVGKIYKEWVTTAEICTSAEVDAENQSGSGSQESTFDRDYESLVLAWLLGAEIRDTEFQAAIEERLNRDLTNSRLTGQVVAAILSPELMRRIYQSHLNIESLRSLLILAILRDAPVDRLNSLRHVDYPDEFWTDFWDKFNWLRETQSRDGIPDSIGHVVKTRNLWRFRAR